MIRGLTLWQPMAWAIAAGHKRIENRSWAPWRGLTHVAIHAGAKYHAPHAEQMREILGIEVPARGDLLYGAILCVAAIDGVIHEDDSIETEAHDSPWFSGPYGWLLRDVRALAEPILRPGAMGLWTLSESELERVRQEWRCSSAS